MKILVINAGSSSLKYQLIDMSNDSVIAKGMCDRIGIDGGEFKLKVPGREDYVLNVHMANHEEAVKLVKLCNEKLENAERRVRLLTEKADGTITDVPFETDNEA